MYLGIWQGQTGVAMKVIKSPSPAEQRSFVEEILLLRACHHGNVVK